MKPIKIKRLTDICDIEIGNACTFIKVINKKSRHVFCECIKNVSYTDDILTYSTYKISEYGAYIFKDKYIKFDKLLKAKNINIEVVKYENIIGNYVKSCYVKVQ